MEPTLGIAFVVGMLSTVHCFGMCAGIVGALTLSLPSHVRARPDSLLPYVLAYNLGRVSSYTLVGALLGALSGAVSEALNQYYGTRLFQVIAAAFLVGLGLYLGGWFPRFAMVERIGRPLWRRLEPAGRRLLPVKSVTRAYFFGIIWGWLPCGLVYSVLTWSLTSGSAERGALMMMAFGLGTLPAVLAAGLLVDRLVKFSRSPRVRKMAGVLIVIVALTNFAFDWLHSGPQVPMNTQGGVPAHEHHH
jgi:sulfite exporter TauE/SafE